MKPIKIVFLSLFTLLVIFIVSLFLIKEKPHQYFDPQNSDNIYTITADSNYFYVNCDLDKSDNQKGFTGIISSAPVDLHQFLNKKIKLKGKFINTIFGRVIRPKNDYRPSNNQLQALEIINISLAE